MFHLLIICWKTRNIRSHWFWSSEWRQTVEFWHTHTHTHLLQHLVQRSIKLKKLAIELVPVERRSADLLARSCWKMLKDKNEQAKEPEMGNGMERQRTGFFMVWKRQILSGIMSKCWCMPVPIGPIAALCREILKRWYVWVHSVLLHDLPAQSSRELSSELLPSWSYISLSED